MTDRTWNRLLVVSLILMVVMLVGFAFSVRVVVEMLRLLFGGIRFVIELFGGIGSFKSG